MGEQLERHVLIERSIIKKYRKTIWKRFLSGVSDYELIQEGDRVAACISGGKDSMLMAKCLQELQRHGNTKFELKFLVMDPGYNPANRRRIEENAALMQIPVTFFETNIFDVVAETDRSPCYLCAKMRRGHLYSEAQKLGCNKIALGHHFDDVIETILMSMLYGAEMKTMMPKLHSSNFAGMELIRPMYLVREADIQAWRRYNDLSFIQCACRLTESCVLGDGAGASKRSEMKEMIRRFRQINPNIEMNIFNSVHNVNLETVIGYRDRNGRTSFLDRYEEWRPGAAESDKTLD